MHMVNPIYPRKPETSSSQGHSRVKPQGRPGDVRGNHPLRLPGKRVPSTGEGEEGMECFGITDSSQGAQAKDRDSLSGDQGQGSEHKLQQDPREDRQKGQEHAIPSFPS